MGTVYPAEFDSIVLTYEPFIHCWSRLRCTCLRSWTTSLCLVKVWSLGSPVPVTTPPIPSFKSSNLCRQSSMAASLELAACQNHNIQTPISKERLTGQRRWSSIWKWLDWVILQQSYILIVHPRSAITTCQKLKIQKPSSSLCHVGELCSRLKTKNNINSRLRRVR